MVTPLVLQRSFIQQTTCGTLGTLYYTRNAYNNNLHKMLVHLFFFCIYSARSKRRG